MSNQAGHAVNQQAAVFAEHEPRVFVLHPETYEQDAGQLKTWLDDKSLRGWQVPTLAYNFRDDGTITVFAVAVHAINRRVATPAV
jgi:hypothetical protein